MWSAGIIRYMNDDGRMSCIYAVCTNFQQLVKTLLFYSELDNVDITYVSCDTFLTLSDADEFILSELRGQHV